MKFSGLNKFPLLAQYFPKMENRLSPILAVHLPTLKRGIDAITFANPRRRLSGLYSTNRFAEVAPEKVDKSEIFTRAIMSETMPKEGDHDCWIGAIDQGTTSTRFFVFDRSGRVVASAQAPVRLLTPTHGWVEQDPIEIIQSIIHCIEDVGRDIGRRYGRTLRECLKGVGLANQRETVVCWDPLTGKPLYNALVWLDTRCADILQQLEKQRPSEVTNAIKSISGLRPTAYFSAGKIAWLCKNVPDVSDRISHNCRIKFGTMDSWIIANFLGMDRHMTDVTNAHRTGLTGLKSPFQWSDYLLDYYQLALVKDSLANQINPSSHVYGTINNGPLAGIPLLSVLGDQHAALYGQGCVSVGDAKCTFGTGCFLLTNIGSIPAKETIVQSGLLSTVAYQIGLGSPLLYATEASLALGGSILEWLSAKVGILRDPSELDELSADDAGGVVFIPALSGFLAPRWDPSAAASLLGLTLSTKKSHILKAVIDSVAYSTKEVVDIVREQQCIPLNSLIVEGGLTKSRKLVQTLADVLQINILVPRQKEGTVYGAAKAAAMALGDSSWGLSSIARFIVRPNPEMKELYETGYRMWLKSVNSK